MNDVGIYYAEGIVVDKNEEAERLTNIADKLLEEAQEDYDGIPSVHQI